MNWKKPVAVYISDMFVSIFNTKDAERFILRHWKIFKPEQLDRTVMACLLSWDGNEKLDAVARGHFIEAARTAGILICDGDQRPVEKPAPVIRRIYRRPFNPSAARLRLARYSAEAGGTLSVVAGGTEFAPFDASSPGEIIAP